MISKYVEKHLDRWMAVNGFDMVTEQQRLYKAEMRARMLAKYSRHIDKTWREILMLVLDDIADENTQALREVKDES